jgi:hypothetical protein
MKNVFISILAVFFALQLEAQSSVTLTLEAGNLSEKLTIEERNRVVNLTLIGTMDARDFKTISDDMPQLEIIDLSQIQVLGYVGENGTSWIHQTYEENSIPKSAFEDMDIVHVILPHSITKIDWEAFDYCRALRSINLPESLKTIDMEAFDKCTSLESLYIPASVEFISSDAFRRSTALITVDEMNPNYSSRDGVLYNKDMTTLIFCPVIKSGLFVVPDYVTKIGYDSFDDCGLITSVELPATVTHIEGEAFFACRSLKNINLHDGLKKIENSVFSYCASLDEIIIPESVDTILNSAFANCSNLKKINIPSSVKYIDRDVFKGCESLKSVYVYWDTPLAFSGLETSNAFYSVDKSSCKLFIPQGTKNKYQTAAVWKGFKNIEEFFLTLSVDALQVPGNEGGTAVIDVLTNTFEWKVSSDQTWLEVTPDFGMGNNRVSLLVKMNSQNTPRNATLTFSAKGVQPVEIPITQAVFTHASRVVKNNFQVYPNPASEAITISGLTGSYKAVLHDLTGKTMLHADAEATAPLSLSGLKPGIYILKLITSEGVIKTKVVKR